MNGKQFLIGLITFCVIVFWVDPAIADWFVGLLPNSLHDWFKFLKVVIWIILVVCTFGITIFISALIGIIFGFKKSKPEVREFQKTGPSKWQQRLEQMQKEQQERSRNR